MQEKKVCENAGYHDKDTNQQDMVEYHVDDCKVLRDEDFEAFKFGGNLSVQKLPDMKPLVAWGQDECIFKQYAFTKNAWIGPEGEMSKIPKDEGLGTMVSGFVCREFGFDYRLTKEE